MLSLSRSCLGAAFLLASLCTACSDPATTAPPDVPDAGNSVDAETDIETDAVTQDVFDDSGEVLDALVEVETGPTKPGLGIDWSLEPLGAAPRYAPEATATDWLAVGWPSDLLLNAGGFVDLRSFPDPKGLELIKLYTAFGETILRGWGLNTPVYVAFDGDLDPTSLPDDEGSMTDPLASVQLVNVTAEHPRFAEQIPLKLRWYGDATVYVPARTLALLPVAGFPLAEAATYCAIVTRGVRDANGDYLAPAGGFDTVFEGDDSAFSAFRQWLPTSSLRRSDIALATCFTTQSATGELEAVRDFLEQTQLPVPTGVAYEDGWYDHEFHGAYVAANFQAGEKPYINDGEMRFDDEGVPVIQSRENIDFVLVVPRDEDMPVDGWPTVIYSHGTGGDISWCDWDAEPFADLGFAVLCINQPLHGSRGPNGKLLSFEELAFYTFNFVNPQAGRMSFRQSVIDTFTMTRMLAAGVFDLDADATAFGEPVRIDPERIHFFGHSHGGISGAMAIALDPRIKGAVLSGAGGLLVPALVLQAPDLVAAVLETDLSQLDRFHPTLALVQTLVDASDPVNYAPYWFDPAPGGAPLHLFMTQGMLDESTPPDGISALAASGRVPYLAPVAEMPRAHELLKLAPAELPVSEQLLTSDGTYRTVGIRQYVDGDHFVAFEDEPTMLWGGFLQSYTLE